MPARIKDQFDKLPVSRQRKYQMRKKKAGLCVTCGDSARAYGKCLKHAVYSREAQRERAGAKRRLASKTYALEAQVKKKQSKRNTD